MRIEHFFDKNTFTLTYLVFDETTKDAVIIDPVLDFDQASGKISFESMNALTSKTKQFDLNVHMILETHAHADHLSSSQYLKEIFPNAVLAIGENIKKVQATFKPVFNMADDFRTNGSQFDRLLKDGEDIQLGSLSFKVLETPGHTPACVSYVFNDAVFTGDALFMPDFGTGRCDFPQGCAEDLFQSVHEKLYKLPDSTRVFVGHDYMPNGRELAFESSIKEEKEKNIQLKNSTSKSEFVEMRQSRDKNLNTPKLLYPSVQINIDAGHLPKEESSGASFVKIPINLSNR